MPHDSRESEDDFGDNSRPQPCEGYPSYWWHATIHLNPETGEMHSDGDHRVRAWLEERIKRPKPGDSSS